MRPLEGVASVAEDLEVPVGMLPTVEGHALVCALAVMLVALWQDAIECEVLRGAAVRANAS